MNHPIYNPNKTYLENAEEGPFFKGAIPKRAKTQPIDFLDFKIASPIGIPAGPLLNARWISLAAQLGYDLLTYKTIRCHEHPSHPLPNVAYVKTGGQLRPGKLPKAVERIQTPPEKLDDLSITNSFGNPSRSSNYLEKDIPTAIGSLNPGQLLIVSVFGTSLDEYVKTARLAKEWGAPVIEANYSCPNVSQKEGSLYADPKAVYTFSSKMVQTIGDTPFIIKVGAITDPDLMRQIFVAAARAGVRAVCGINTISMNVLPPLGPGRDKCGICGGAIREAAVTFTRAGREIIDQEKLDLKLMTTGGVTQPHHFKDLLDAGADIAMTATGMMWNPYLALQYHQGAFEPCLTTP